LGNEAVQLARCAALLHDIGHGPFSHVSEYALDRYGDHSKVPEGQKQEKIHELVTAGIINTDPDIVRILGKEKCREIIKVLSTGYGEPALKATVSGPLDADKQDYLLRDSHFCGVRYGVFDIHQFQRSLISARTNTSRELMIDPDGIHAVEQYVMAKYYMTTNVYRHKVRLITDQMIVRAIALGIEKDNIEPLRDLYAFDNSDEFVKNYCTWDDARFMYLFGGSTFERTKCQQLLERLSKRRLLKRVFHEKPSCFSPEKRETVFRLAKLELHETRQTLERAIAAEISERTGKPIEPDFVILNTFSIKSVREMSQNDEAGILIQGESPRLFLDESSLFASIQKGFEEQFVEVYAPAEWASPKERTDLCDQLREPLRKIIENGVSSEKQGSEA